MTVRVDTFTGATGSFLAGRNASTPAVAALFAIVFTIAFLVLVPRIKQDVHDDLARAFMEGRL